MTSPERAPLHRRALLATLLAAIAMPGRAQPASPGASAHDIVEALAPAPVTRGLGRNLKVEPAKIDLSIGFDFDSARLRDDSRPQLERLAEALRSERLAALRFRIEGHTDAQGTAAHNQALSARRAESVVAFLARQGVVRERLQPVGKGYTEPLDPADPKSARNRRVRIVTLEPAP